MANILLKYTESIDKFLINQLSKSDVVEVLPFTPKIYQKMGLNNYQIIITQNTLAKLLKDKAELPGNPV